MSIKTGAGLAAYACSHIGDCYWWGTFGQRASQELLDYKKKQYPDVYNSPLYADAPQQFGKIVFDCVGLIKGYLFLDSGYDGSKDVTAAGLYTNCIQKGTISKLPEEKGVCVFTASLDHVGVYVGNGYVVESAGHKVGVVKSSLVNRTQFALWGKPKWIEYDIKEDVKGETYEPFNNLSDVDKKAILSLPMLSEGSSGIYVKIMQALLKVKPTGIFDSETKKRVIEFQTANYLEIDGICGKNTWTRLI